MVDMNREQLAFHFFEVMNETNSRFGTGWTMDQAWEMMRVHGWDQGYLRLADEVIRKGYKP